MTTITTLPTAPQRSDPTNFATRYDAWVTQFTNTTTAEINTVAGEVNANAGVATTQAAGATTQATAAAASAAAAAASAINSANSAGAAMWSVVTSYTLGQAATSGLNYQVYRRIVAGSGGLDPSLDNVNWVPVVPPVAALNLYLAANFGAF